MMNYLLITLSILVLSATFAPSAQAYSIGMPTGPTNPSPSQLGCGGFE
jgi:hypothetical protein